MVSTAIKQTATLIYWLALLCITQASYETDPAFVPVEYAFAGAIALGLFVTLIWVVNPIITGRMYRQRISELEIRVRTLEARLDTEIARNRELHDLNVQYKIDNDALLNHIHKLSYEINQLKNASPDSR